MLSSLNNQTGSPVVILTLLEGEPVVIPGGTWSLRAEFSREGADLVLTGPEGQHVIIKGYFEAGIDADRVQDLHAPIGLPGLDGKQPGTITVAADFLLRLNQDRIEKIRPQTDSARGRS